MNSLPKLKKHPFSLVSRLGIVLASAALLSVFSWSNAFGGDDKTEKQFTLDNGLKVFLYERHNQPLVNIVAAVNAGSKDETDETSGLVHLLEHYILFRERSFGAGPRSPGTSGATADISTPIPARTWPFSRLSSLPSFPISA